MAGMISSFCSMKFASLLCLLLQNASLVMLMRYSRSRHDRPMFLASTAVATDEMSKFCLSSVMIVITYFTASKEKDEEEGEGKGENGGFFGFLREHVITRYSLFMAVPALLYTVQKNLLYVALTNLDACVYQVTYNAKLLTTAVFSYLILGRTFSYSQQAGLGLLMVGVALVQASQAGDLRKPSGEHPLVGLAAIGVACCTSGFASVYFEYWLKKSQDFWVKQAQLSFYASVLALTAVATEDWAAVKANGFYQGWDWIVCLTVACEAGGGIIVAVVTKYADSVAKNFATALSLLATTVMSWLFWKFEVSLTFIAGAAMTLLATQIYQTQLPAMSKETFGKGACAVVLMVLFWVAVDERGLAQNAFRHAVGHGSAALVVSSGGTARMGPGPVLKHHLGA